MRASGSKPKFLLPPVMSPPKQDELLIAVMGPTGAGKTTFVNLVSGSNLPVGRNLKSCTSSVARSESFEIPGCDKRIILVDTPGFDDTMVPDTEVLKKIALYMATTHEQGFKLSGIIYMHNIRENKVGGTGRRNLAMLRELCGTDALSNVVMVTSRWEEEDLTVAVARETELKEDATLFKPILYRGGKARRHYNSRESAIPIVAHVTRQHPKTFRIQREILKEGKSIEETAAGKCLLNYKTRDFLARLSEIESEMTEDLERTNARLRKELEAERVDYRRKIAVAEQEVKDMARAWADDKRRIEQQIQLARKSLDSNHAGGQKEKLAQLSRQASRNSQASSLEVQKMGEQLEAAEKADRRASRIRTAKIVVGVLAGILDIVLIATTPVPIPIVSGATKALFTALGA